MSWIVRQENAELGTFVDVPGSELTEQKAYNRAAEESQKWLRQNWAWDKNNPTAKDPNRGNINGPSPGFRFKWWYDTQISGAYFIEARYDYRQIDGQTQTNSIIWHVVEV